MCSTGGGSRPIPVSVRAQNSLAMSFDATVSLSLFVARRMSTMTLCCSVATLILSSIGVVSFPRPWYVPQECSNIVGCTLDCCLTSASASLSRGVVVSASAMSWDCSVLALPLTARPWYSDAFSVPFVRSLQAHASTVRSTTYRCSTTSAMPHHRLFARSKKCCSCPSINR